MSDSIAFTPGQPSPQTGPLARYLPPILDGMATTWLKEHLPIGSWVLDPFGASPRLAAEAARAGYRVLAAVNNPVARFLLEIAANPPNESELSAALAELAAAHKGNERIEPHIRSLYMSKCAQCGLPVMVEAFIWNREATSPSNRLYHCPNCKDYGERPLSQEDIQHATQFSFTGLHRARALERVAALNDPDRPYVEEALETYLPRAVYALFTLINKLDSFSSSRRRSLAALLLAAFDQTNTLWPHPTVRARPRQLTVPPRFQEKNVWQAMEQAIEAWIADTSGLPEVPLVAWPEQPSTTSGISLFMGRLKDLVDQFRHQASSDLRVGAVLTALPRPNQAYWTLCALWAGWLWGREAAAPFKSVLRRRRYDWAWHCTALHAAYKNLTLILEPGTPFLGVIGEAEPGFLSAGVIAADLAGFDLSGLALRSEIRQAQILWEQTTKDVLPSGPAFPFSQDHIQELSQDAAQAYLHARGEPASYLHLHAAALLQLGRNHAWITTPQLHPADAYGQTQNGIQQALILGNFTRFGGSEQSLETGKWWLTENNHDSERLAEETTFSLADRTEMELVRYLQHHAGCTLDELDSALCLALTGLLTPDPGLVQECLKSYGEQDRPGSDNWQLRPQDTPQGRREDLKVMNDLLKQIGAHLGYLVMDRAQKEKPASSTSLMPIIWQKPDGTPEYIFFVLASAIFGKIVLTPTAKQRETLTQYPRKIIVIPGGRAGLIAYKLDRDPRLNQAIGKEWQFIKFRHLRRLAENKLLTRNNLDEHLPLDPLANDDPQMTLW